MNFAWHMFSIQCEELRINHLTPFLVASDNALCLLLFLWRACFIKDFKWRSSSFSIWGCVLKGLFWERYILKGQIAFEGHWRLQSWTLTASSMWVTKVRGFVWGREWPQWWIMQTESHFTHEPRAVTMKLWEPKRKCPKAAVPTHLQHHVVVWSWALKCSVKPYVTGPSTKCYFNEFSIHAGPHAC